MTYLDHFGLREPPFSADMHAAFFFPGGKRGATLEALIYAITHDEGVVKVSGTQGSGKSSLCRMLAERLPACVQAVCLTVPPLTPEDALSAIADHLDIPPSSDRAPLPFRTLQEGLNDICNAGRRTALLIDEAHAMPLETLETIGRLALPENGQKRFMHIVLFGQSELDNRLRSPDMRCLRERITHNFALEPLTVPEIENYLAFRLRAAGHRGQALFTPDAIELIDQATGGVIGGINILAEKAMQIAFSERRLLIERQHVETFVAAEHITQRPSRRPKRRMAAVLAATGALVIGIGAVSALNRSTPTPPGMTSLRPTPASAGAATPTNESTFFSLTGAVPAPEPAPASRLETLITETERWLREVPDTHFVIQLLRTDASEVGRIENFLGNEAAELDPEQIRVYRSRLSGQDRLGVIYGDFATKSAAQKELKRLNQGKSSSHYYIRPTSKLK